MYIVWINNKGYYVNYLNKSEDKFSDNWIVAKKYSSLGSALSRIAINIEDYQITFDKFFDSHVILDSRGNHVGFDKISANRDFNLNSIGIGDEKYPIEYFILKSYRFGHIKKVLPDNTLVDCWGEIYQYISDKIKSNSTKFEKKMKLFNGLGKDNYLYKGNGVSDEEFWNTL
jgi:hypothetical protein